MRGLTVRRAGSDGFSAKGGVDDTAGQRWSNLQKLVARQYVLESAESFPFTARFEHRTFGIGHPVRGQIDGGLPRSAVHQQDGARNLNAGEIEELVALTKFQVGRRFRGSLHDDHRVTDSIEHLCPPGREFSGSKS